MSNYTKTTNFATKDALVSGNPAKIVKGTEIDTEFNNIAVASGTKADKASPTFTGTVNLPITTAASLSVGGDGVTVTGIKDEDDMASNSATKLASQQSIKAYVDSQVTAQDLDVTDGTTSISIDLDSEALSLLGGTGVTSTALGNGVTLAIDATVATLTGSQTLSNKTLTTPAITGPLTTDSTIDGRDVAVDGTKLDTVETNADVTDTTNVTAAGALMDSEVTNLAQVKAFDSADYATAVQGATADAALPKAGGAMTGAITTNSTFDGRDVATDGTKLDGIEALADVTDVTNVTAAGALMDSELTSITAVKALNQGVATTDSPSFVGLTTSGEITANGGIALGDNDKATFGASDDLQIYHDGFNTLIKESGAGSLLIDATNTYFRNAAGTKDYAWMVDGGAVSLFHNGSAKLATTATGIDVTGTATMDGLSVAASTADYLASITNSNGTDAGGGLFVNTRWNTAANSVAKFVSNSGSNVVANFAGNGDISFYEDTGTTAKLFWDASAESLGIGTSAPSAKLEVNGGGTATTGGTVVVRQDGDTNADGLALTSSNATSHRFWKDSGGKLNIGPSNLPSALVQDLSGFVGIGTSLPASALDVTGAGTFGALSSKIKVGLNGDSISSDADFYIQTSTANALILRTNFTERMRINSAGNVGIGTSSPATKLEVEGNSGAATGTVSAPVAIRITDTSDIGAGGDITNPYAALQFFGRDTSNEGPTVHAQIGTIYDDPFGAGSHLTFSTWNSGITSAAERMRISSTGVVEFKGGITEAAVTLTGTATTINLATATNFVHALTGATTYTFSNPAVTGNVSAFTLKIIQDSTARTITWPSSVDWPGGTAPTLTATSGGVDIFTFFTLDGGVTYYGFTAGQAMA